MTATSYQDAGVDPKRAERLLKGLGVEGFGAVIDLDSDEMKARAPFTHPYWSTHMHLVMSTDGVGTKVKVAEKMKKFDTLGIDLVAMCVNDVICHGAVPFAFLDYYAVGRIRPRRGKLILQGIMEGCRIAGCNLVGGETAEMPGVYTGDKFDLAGFCVGIVHTQHKRPDFREWTGIKEGDAIVGIPSSGLHANGYSLVRKCYDRLKLPYTDELMTPTRIYCEDVLPIMGKIKGLAHITGGGIHGNLPRCLPDNLTYDITLPHYPRIFQHMQALAEMKRHDVECTFNCGWGMMIVVDQKELKDVLGHIKDARELGVVIAK